MESTTVKLSVAPRDWIRALGGTTYEQTIVEALDLLEADRFWAQAEQAAAWRRSRRPQERELLTMQEAAVDAAFDGIG